MVIQFAGGGNYGETSDVDVAQSAFKIMLNYVETALQNAYTRCSMNKESVQEENPPPDIDLLTAVDRYLYVRL